MTKRRRFLSAEELIELGYDADQLSFCGVCGAKLLFNVAHRCSEATLNAIDAANARAANEADRPSDREPFYRTWADRLSDGFRIMGAEE